MAATFSTKPRICFEIEKVIGVSSEGTYQVQWAPAWVSKFHLVGCEHLIQEFLRQQFPRQPHHQQQQQQQLTKLSSTDCEKDSEHSSRQASGETRLDGESFCTPSNATSSDERCDIAAIEDEAFPAESTIKKEQSNWHMSGRNAGNSLDAQLEIDITEDSDRPSIFDLFEAPQSDSTNVLDTGQSELSGSTSLKLNGNEYIVMHREEQQHEPCPNYTGSSNSTSNTSQTDEIVVKMEEEDQPMPDFPGHLSFPVFTKEIKRELISPGSDNSTTKQKRGRGRPRKKRSFPFGKRKQAKASEQSVVELASQREYSAAFEKALATADLSLLVILCKQVKPMEVFKGGTNLHLSQSLLMKLIQQLSVDLDKDTETKVQYLMEGISHLDKKDELTREHMSTVLNFLTGQLYQTIDTMTRTNPTDEQLEPLNLLLRTGRTMLSRCRR